MRRPLVLAGVLSCAALLCVALSWRRPQPWTPERLHAALEVAGLHYEAMPAFGGLLLKSPRDPLTWEHFRELTYTPGAVAEVPGRIYIAPSPFGGGGPHSALPVGAAPLDNLLLHAHPDTLARLKSALGR